MRHRNKHLEFESFLAQSEVHAMHVSNIFSRTATPPYTVVQVIRNESQFSPHLPHTST